MPPHNCILIDNLIHRDKITVNFLFVHCYCCTLVIDYAFINL